MADLSQFSDEELDAAIARKRQARLADVSDEELEAAIAKKRAAEPSMLESAWTSLAGNATEDIPSVYGSDFGAQNEKAGRKAGFQGMAAVFGDDNDVARAIQRDHPDARLVADENGNQVVQMPDGKRYYVNDPGLDAMDVARFGGKVMAFMPAGRLAGLGGSVAMRMGIGAAASGATDVATQAAAGRSVDDFSAGQVAASAGLGGAAELVMPAAQWAARALRNKLTPAAAAAKTGREIIRSAGLEGADEAAEILGRNADQVRAGASPEAILAEQQLGYRLTRGQKTGNEALLRREEMLRAFDPEGPLKQLDDANWAQNVRNTEALRGMMARGTPEVYEQSAAQRMQSAAQEAEQAAKAGVNRAYDAAGDAAKGVYAATDDIAALPKRIQAAFKARVALAPELTPATLGGQRIINEFVEEAGSGAVPMQSLMDFRKRLVALRGAANSPTDRRAFTAMQREFDSWMDEAITRNFTQVGSDAVEAFKGARREAQRYFERFHSDDEVGRSLTRILAEESTPEQVANAVLGAHGITKPGAAAITRRYLAAVGRDSDGANALRDVVGRRLMMPAGETGGVQKTSSLLRDAIAGRGRSVMSELFTREELVRLEHFQRVLQRFFVPKAEGMFQRVGRSSGTAERFVAWLGQSRLGQLPLGRQLRALAIRGMSASATRPLLQPRTYAQPQALAPGAAIVAGGQQAQDEPRK